MFPELNNIIDTESGQLDGKFLLVLEKGSDASFVLHHYLASYVKQNYNVCLVLFTQSFTHYSSVASKLSVNLPKAREDGRLAVVDGLTNIGKLLCGDEDSMEGSLIEFSAAKGNSLKPLFLQVKTQYDELAKTGPTIVIVDDMSVLLSLGTPSSDLYFLVRYLQRLTSDQTPPETSIGAEGGGHGGGGRDGRGALLTTLHCPAEDDEATSLSKQLFHLCDVCVEVAGLAGAGAVGGCKDVHGEMTVTNARHDAAVGNYGSRRMQFKTSDKTVAFFAAGTSGAVL